MNKVVIIGPESTGKTTLSRALAHHYKAPLVREYAREYIDQLDRDYREEDLLEIAKGQMALEDSAANQTGQLIFCDTDLRVIKLWSLFKYGNVHDWITDQIARRKYHLYLLTAIDLPWEADVQREHPKQRDLLFSLYKKELEESQQKFQIVYGWGEQRVQSAIRALQACLNTN